MRKIKTIPKLEEKKRNPEPLLRMLCRFRLEKEKKGEELAKMIGQTDIRAEN